MLPYYLLVFAPPAAAYLLCSRQSDKKRRAFMSMLLFFLGYLLLLCLRDITIGVDNKNYEVIFERISGLAWDRLDRVGLENGFVYLNKIVSTYFDDYQALVVAVSLIAIVPMAIFYLKKSESSFLAIALFIGVAPFAMYFSGLRQILAMAFVYPAYYFARKSKAIPFIILCALAMLFHKSAFIIFVLYPLMNFKITPKRMIAIAPLILFTYIFNERILAILLRFMDEKYSEMYGEVKETGAFMMILLFAIFTFFAFVIPDENSLDKEIIGLRNILVVCLVLQLFSPINSVAMRMNYYFLPFIPILIPKIINRAKPQYRQIAMLATWVLTIFFIVRFFYNASLSSGGLHTFPYKSIFD